MTFRRCLSLILLPLAMAVCLSAGPVTVAGTASFSGGIFGDWSINYTTGASDLYIQAVSINVAPANLKFDTSPGGFGFALSQDVSPTGPVAPTGFTAFSATGAALDGQTLLGLGFNHFQPGEAFTFQGDVDEDLALQSCSGLGIGATIACVAGNVVTGADATLVNGNEFSGVEIVLTMGGANYVTTDITGAFASTGGNNAVANWRGEVNPVPEPSTFVMLGAGLAGIGLLRRRFRRTVSV